MNALTRDICPMLGSSVDPHRRGNAGRPVAIWPNSPWYQAARYAPECLLRLFLFSPSHIPEEVP